MFKIIFIFITLSIVSCKNDSQSKIIELNDDLIASSLNNKAVELQNSGDLERSLILLKAGELLNENNSMIHYNLSKTFYQMNKFEEALVSINKAINILDSSRFKELKTEITKKIK